MDRVRELHLRESDVTRPTVSLTGGDSPGN